MTGRVTEPRVSVVIPTHNRARDLPRCLQSLAEQTRKDFEVIVCDDGSTDDTRDVVNAFVGDLDIAYDLAERWGGPARPRNRGIAQARAPYVAFLDADDWWAPRKLAMSVPYLDGGADVVYHDLFLVTRENQRVLFKRARARDLSPPAFLDLLMNNNALPLSSVIMRRSLLMTIGGMPEDRELIAMEDYDCWLSAARVTEKFVRVPKTLGYYWAGGGNISSDIRTLRLLDVFEGRYGDAIRGAGNAMPPWVAYARGRALYRSGAHDAARAQLSLVDPRTAPIVMTAKTVLTRLAMAVAR